MVVWCSTGVVLEWCFCGRVFLVLFLWWCFCGGAVWYWSSTGVVFLWSCFSGIVFVVVFLLADGKPYV